jgi:HEAT repeat protein
MGRDRSADPPKTADELMLELLQDPEYLARRARQQQELRAIRKVNAESARPVIADLRAAGFRVNDVADLFNKPMNYKNAIPILLAWLPRMLNPDVKEDIVRALSVKWARPVAAPALVVEFKKANGPNQSSLRWAIGNALEVVADDSVFEDLIRISIDRRFGNARQMVVQGLGKMKNPRTVAILVRLLDDEDVSAHAIFALGKLRAVEARSAIEPFLDHSRSLLRKEARKALAKIDAAQ